MLDPHKLRAAMTAPLDTLRLKGRSTTGRLAALTPAGIPSLKPAGGDSPPRAAADALVAGFTAAPADPASPPRAVLRLQLAAAVIGELDGVRLVEVDPSYPVSPCLVPRHLAPAPAAAVAEVESAPAGWFAGGPLAPFDPAYHRVLAAAASAPAGADAAPTRVESVPGGGRLERTSYGVERRLCIGSAGPMVIEVAAELVRDPDTGEVLWWDILRPDAGPGTWCVLRAGQGPCFALDPASAMAVLPALLDPDPRPLVQGAELAAVVAGIPPRALLAHLDWLAAEAKAGGLALGEWVPVPEEARNPRRLSPAGLPLSWWGPGLPVGWPYVRAQRTATGVVVEVGNGDGADPHGLRAVAPAEGGIAEIHPRWSVPAPATPDTAPAESAEPG